MRKNKSVLLGSVGAATLCVMLSACGATAPISSIGGVASPDTPVSGISLRDSSTPPQARSASTSTDGSFALDTSGLAPPYLLKATVTAGGAVYAISAQGEPVDVNEVTNVVYAATTGSLDADDAESTYQSASSTDTRKAAGKLTATLDALKVVLAPLYALYGITNPLTDRVAVRAMLRDVRFTVSNGTVTVTNRETGGVIFTGPLSDLASGTFDAANLPGGTITPPPPTLDGAALYTASCATCHGPLATSTKLGATSARIQAAIGANVGGMGSLSTLTSAQVDAIAAALSVTAPPPATCTYAYSTWAACTSSNTQTRTVTSSTPSGCTGTPVLTQACTYVDGAALYTQYCSGCHGTSKKGSSASLIQSAIDSNRGGMGSLSFLTPAQIAAISAAP
jgi:mono/diheme cytochrome c family protein